MGGIYGAGRGIYAGAAYAARGGDDAFNRRYAQLKTIAQMQEVPEPEQGAPSLLNGFSTAVDLISRGLYSVTGAADVVLGNGAKGETIHSRVFREFFSGIGGLKGDKEMWDKVLEEGGVPEGGHLSDLIGKNWLTKRFDPSTRSAVALGLDIFTDPTTYITVGAGGGAKIMSRGGLVRGTKKFDALAREAAHAKFSKIAGGLGEEYVEKLAKVAPGTKEYGTVTREIEMQARSHLRRTAREILAGNIHRENRVKAARAYLKRSRNVAGIEHRTHKSAQRLMQSIIEGRQPLSALGKETIEALGIESVEDLVAKTSIRFMGKSIVDLSESGVWNRFMMNKLGGGVVTAKFGKLMASGTPAGNFLKGTNNIRKGIDGLFNRDAMNARQFDEYIQLKQSLYDRTAAGGKAIERELGEVFDGIPRSADDIYESLTRALDDPENYFDDYLVKATKHVDEARARSLFDSSKRIHDRLWDVDSRLLKLSPDSYVPNYIAHVIKNFGDLNPNQRDAIEKALGDFKRAKGRLVERPGIGRFQEQRHFDTIDELMAFYDGLRMDPRLKHLELPRPELQMDARTLLEARMKASNEMVQLSNFFEKVGYKFARIKSGQGAALLEELMPAIRSAVRASRGEIKDGDKELLARLLSTSTSVQLGEGQTKRLVYKGLQGVDEAVKDGVLNPGAAKQLRKLIDSDPNFDRDSVVEFVDTVRTLTDDEAARLGVEKTAGVARAETLQRYENDVMHTTIRLYKGADAQSVTKEWYRRGYGRLSPTESGLVDDAFEAAGGKELINPETGAAYRSADDWFSVEGEQHFFNAGKFLPEGSFTRPATTVKKKGRGRGKKGQQDLFETEGKVPTQESVERALEVTGMFERARHTLKRIAARVMKMQDHEVDASVRKMFDDVASGGQSPLEQFNTELSRKVADARGTPVTGRFHYEQGVGAGAHENVVFSQKFRDFRTSLGLSQGDPVPAPEFIDWLKNSVTGHRYREIIELIEPAVPKSTEFYLIDAGAGDAAIKFSPQQLNQLSSPQPGQAITQHMGEWGEIDSNVIVQASQGGLGGVQMPMFGRRSRINPDEPRNAVWFFGRELNPDNATSEEVMVHELIHAATTLTHPHSMLGTVADVVKDPALAAEFNRVWRELDNISDTTSGAAQAVVEGVEKWLTGDKVWGYYKDAWDEIEDLSQQVQTSAVRKELKEWKAAMKGHHERVFPDPANRPSMLDAVDQTVTNPWTGTTVAEDTYNQALNYWAPKIAKSKLKIDDETVLPYILGLDNRDQWRDAEMITYGLTNQSIVEFMDRMNKRAMLKFEPLNQSTVSWKAMVDETLGLVGGTPGDGTVYKRLQRLLSETVEAQSKLTRNERQRIAGVRPKNYAAQRQAILNDTKRSGLERQALLDRLDARSESPGWVYGESKPDDAYSRFHYEVGGYPDPEDVLTRDQKKKRLGKAQERAIEEEFAGRPAVVAKRGAEREAEQRKNTRRKVASPALSRTKAAAKQAERRVSIGKARVKTLEEKLAKATKAAEKQKLRGRLEEAKLQVRGSERYLEGATKKQAKAQSEFDRLVKEQQSFEEQASALTGEQGKKLTASKLRDKDLEDLKAAAPEVQAAYMYEVLNNVDSIPHLAAILARHEDIFKEIAPDVLDRVRKEMSERYFNPSPISPFGGQTWRRVEMPMADGSNQTWELPDGIADDLVGWKEEWLKQPEVGQLLRMYDITNNVFKGSVTSMFPAFHFRNAYSNVAQMMYSIGLNALNPIRHAEAMRLMLYGSKRGKAALDKLGLGGEFTFTTRNGLRYTADQLLELADEHQIRVNFDQMVDIISEHPKAGSRGKVGNLVDGLLAPYKTGKAAGTQIETEARFMAWLDLLHKGFTPADAAEEVKRVLFDYGNLSQFEKQIMRRIIPFYTWTSKNLRLQMNELMRRPGLVNNMTKPFRDRGPDNDMLPEYVRGDLKLRLEKKPGEAGAWLTGIDLPINNMELLFKGGLGETMFQWVGMMNPFMKGILEMSFDKNTFTGKPIRGAQQIGNLGMLIEKFPKPLQEYFELEKYEDNYGNSRYLANGTKTYLVFKSWALSRMVGSAASWNAAMQNDKKAAGFWKLMTGLTFREYDLTEGQRIMIRNRFKALEERLLEKGLILPLNLTRPRPDVKPATASKSKRRRSSRGIYS